MYFSEKGSAGSDIKITFMHAFPACPILVFRQSPRLPRGEVFPPRHSPNHPHHSRPLRLAVFVLFFPEQQEFCTGGVVSNAVGFSFAFPADGDEFPESPADATESARSCGYGCSSATAHPEPFTASQQPYPSRTNGKLTSKATPMLYIF